MYHGYLRWRAHDKEKVKSRPGIEVAIDLRLEAIQKAAGPAVLALAPSLHAGAKIKTRSGEGVVVGARNASQIWFTLDGSDTGAWYWTREELLDLLTIGQVSLHEPDIVVDTAATNASTTVTTTAATTTTTGTADTTAAAAADTAVAGGIVDDAAAAAATELPTGQEDTTASTTTTASAAAGVETERQGPEATTTTPTPTSTTDNLVLPTAAAAAAAISSSAPELPLPSPIDVTLALALAPQPTPVEAEPDILSFEEFARALAVSLPSASSSTTASNSSSSSPGDGGDHVDDGDVASPPVPMWTLQEDEAIVCLVGDIADKLFVRRYRADFYHAAAVAKVAINNACYINIDDVALL